jgi:NADH-quinone oxidoreductase subunit C
VPDATGLELIRQELGDSVLDTIYFRERATLVIDPRRVRAVLAQLRAKGYASMTSLHGVDYYPEEPRLGVLYELLDMQRVDRISVKLRLPSDAPEVDSVTPDGDEHAGWPTAGFQEREVFDMFGVVFRGHPDLRRILMPEDYEGYPQRRDFPVGGEPVVFTHNESPIVEGAE